MSELSSSAKIVIDKARDYVNDHKDIPLSTGVFLLGEVERMLRSENKQAQEDEVFVHRDDTENLNFRHMMPTYLKGHKGFIAGGCFKNLLSNDEVKDFDVYFRNEVDFSEAVEYYKRTSDYSIVYENDKVIAFKNKYSKKRVELVRALFGTPAEIINEFDFTITKFAYYSEEELVTDPDTGDEETRVNHFFVHHKDFFEHLHMKRLVIDNKIIRPGSTYERTYKYQRYGYALCRESKVKVIDALRSDEFTPTDLSASLYDGLD